MAVIVDLFTIDLGNLEDSGVGEGFFPPFLRLGDALLFSPHAVKRTMPERNLLYIMVRTNQKGSTPFSPAQEDPCRWERGHRMNYSQILEALNKASLFELYRLQQAIRRSLEDPARIRQIKNSLRVGQDIEYFEAEDNRLIEASIVELKRTKVLVKNRHDGALWNIPFYFINLDRADVAISNPTGKLDRNTLKIGDKVAFKDRKGNEQFGEVIKLNPKTAGVLVGTTRWKVSYGLLSSIIEGELGRESNVIEGQPTQGQFLGKE